MAERVSCLCPGCRRTISYRELSGRGHNEFICARHWSAVPRELRKRLAKVRRLIRRADRQAKPDHVTSVLRRVEERRWQECRTRAVEEVFLGVGI